MIWTIVLTCVIVFISLKFNTIRWHCSKFVNNVKIMLEQKSFHEISRDMYQEFPDKRFIQVDKYYKPILMVRDPELIRQMVVKDFDHFSDHFSGVSDEEPLFTKNICLLKGQKWRHMRATLNPAFTSSKIKAMFHLMTDCAQQFTRYFDEKVEDLIEVDLKDIFSRYTMDVIGTCVFGVQCDSLKNRNNKFYLMGIEATHTNGFWKRYELMLLVLIPKFARFFGLSMFSKRVSEFFINLVQKTVEHREKNKIVRPDMLHLLMEARKGLLKYEENQIKKDTVVQSTIGTASDIPKQEYTMMDMTAQAMLFLNAGYDTTCTTMIFMAYELCLNPDVQQRLYEEIQQVLKETEGNINYEVLNKMKLLDMVISETLRKWPFMPSIDRECSLPYSFKPDTDSEVLVNLAPKDLISIPVFAIHYDPQYYPNPNRFDPERFSDENMHNIKPYTYLPFGVGPRNCIGSRFALLETKALFFHLLSKYELIATERTPVPLLLHKYSIMLTPDKNVILGLKKRTNDPLQLTTALQKN